MTSEILALIPARGGSKGVPRKNVAVVGGRPLIAWSIAACRDARSAPRVVVTTDDEEIARVAREHGAEVPFMRPAELAKDDTPTLPAVRHALAALAELGAAEPELIVIIQPTSPLRSAGDIDGALELARRRPGATIVGVRRARTHPYEAVRLEPDGTVHDYVEHRAYHRRQDLDAAYEVNGAVYVVPTRTVIEYNDIYGDQTVAYEMPAERSLDIDSEWDMTVAELLLGGKQT